MLINFSHGAMSPSITCDKPCHDKFPAKNIIAKISPMTQFSGFTTEPFVRPPVCLVIEFSCHIIISKIIIDPCVGAHMTKKLELSTGTEPVTSSWMTHDTSNTRRPQPPNSPSRIGGIIMSEPGVVCFENPKFYASPPFSSEILSLAGEVKYRSELGSRLPRSLNRVSKLVIRLLQVGPTGVVALNRVEVWGQPSMCHRPVFDAFLNCFTQSIAIQQPPPKDSKPDKSAKEEASPAGCQVNEEDLPEIPEDFLDALTCEVMAVPMLLPSGKNVDFSTLEKNHIAEAANGRLPRDPFTLRTFTHGYEPAPNLCLKARIDHFLLKYSHCKNVQNLPRTVQTFSHSADSVWRPIGKRGPSAWAEPASERKKSRLIDSDNNPSTDVSPNASCSSGSTQSRPSALGYTPSPLQTDTRADTPDPDRLCIVIEPSPTKGSNSKLDSEDVAVTKVSRSYDTSYADQVLQQSSYTDNLLRQFNTMASQGRGFFLGRSHALGHTPSPLQTDSREDSPDPDRLQIVTEPNPTKGSNSKVDSRTVPVTIVSRNYDTSHTDQVLEHCNRRLYHPSLLDSPSPDYQPLRSPFLGSFSSPFKASPLSSPFKSSPCKSRPSSSADSVGSPWENLSPYRGQKTDAASPTSPEMQPEEEEMDDEVCSGCGGSDSAGGECFYLLPCKHIICRACALGRRTQTDDGKQCGRCGVEYTASSIHRIH